MTGLGLATKVTFEVSVVLQPEGVVSTRVTDAEPLVPQLTLIAFDVVEPLIVPPVTDHEYVLPGVNGTE